MLAYEKRSGGPKAEDGHWGVKGKMLSEIFPLRPKHEKYETFEGVQSLLDTLGSIRTPSRVERVQHQAAGAQLARKGPTRSKYDTRGL